MLHLVTRAARRLLRNLTLIVCGMPIALMLAAAPAPADTYPSRPVRIIVPYGPGGIADVTMRMVAQNLSQHLGQQFFIENRPGAGGIVGMQSAKEAPADGYTLVMLGGGLTIAKALFKSLPYNIETDFTPVSTTASYGLVIATKTGSPYKTIKDVIAAAKAHPGTLNFGTINAGSAQNLSAELFRTMSGLDVTIVPYKTTPDLANAVLRGDVDVAFEYYVGFQSPIINDQMTVLATTGPRTREQFAERPDRHRKRAARLRSNKLEWARRSGGNACRYRRLAQSRRGWRPEVARGAEILERGRHGRAQHVARRFAQSHHE